MKKKAEGLSLSVVVVAAIALVVLIILILIFSGRINIFRQGVDECPAGTGQADSIDSSTGYCPGTTSLPLKQIKVGTEWKYCCPKATTTTPFDDQSTSG